MEEMEWDLCRDEDGTYRLLASREGLVSGFEGLTEQSLDRLQDVIHRGRILAARASREEQVA